MLSPVALPRLSAHGRAFSHIVREAKDLGRLRTQASAEHGGHG